MGKSENVIDALLTTGDAARRLARSAEAVRGYERVGRLPAQRTQNGQRLFRLSDVIRLAKQLANNK